MKGKADLQDLFFPLAFMLMNGMYSDFKWNRVLWKDRKLATYGPKGPKRWEKRKENDRRKVSDAAVILQHSIFMLLLLGEVRPPLDIAFASCMRRPFCVQCRAEIILHCKCSSPNQAGGWHRGKGQQDLTNRVIFLLLIPTLLWTRDAL